MFLLSPTEKPSRSEKDLKGWQSLTFGVSKAPKVFQLNRPFIVFAITNRKTFEVRKRPQRLAVPDLWGFQNPEGLDGGKG
ncbi:hypothetical protein [Mongoliibacter ruber]|uniref:hypothetical protein n=1 Tax=Mongoliibacter ruber TaxID=1750599 RepID=UPI000D056546|nr:hypothetical protein [Mongoliibacter ruber]